MDYQLGVVVLNYNKFEATIECVESLKKQEGLSILIVIVDNGSNNKSYEVIKNKYKNEQNIVILKSDRNLGYARGNNLGIKYLLHIGVQNIFLSNSDILFGDKSVMSQLYSEIDQDTGVLVPTIKNLDGSYDQRVIYKRRFIRFRLLKNVIKQCIVNLNGMIRDKYTKGYCDGKKCEPVVKRNYDLIRNWNQYLVISGSGYLISSYYFDVYHGIFPETFLYGEEEAMLVMLVKSGLRTKVVETGSVVHVGGASTPDNMKRWSYARCKTELDSKLKTLWLMMLPDAVVRRKY